MKKFKFIIFALVGFLFLGVKSVNAANLGSIADEVAPDNRFIINAVAPTTPEEFDFYMNAHSNTTTVDYSSQNVHFMLDNCNSTYTTCDLVVTEQGLEDPLPLDELTRSVTMVWKPTNLLVKNRIDTYIETLTDIQGMGEWGPNEYYFDLTDMSIINYYVNANTNGFDTNIVNKTFGYSETLRNMFNNANMTYSIDFRAGTSYPFQTSAFGGLIFNYGGVIYGVADRIGIKFIEVIYVPSETELSDTALIAAASNRIEDYLPGSNITITAGEELNTVLNEFEEPMDFSELIDTTKTSNKTYLVNFESFSVPFLIVADSSKMTDPKFATNDINTNVSVSSEETSIPLDTVISVSELDEDSEEYQRLAQLIGAEKMKSYDLALFSGTKNSNITRLDNGKFLVSIPIPTELEGKTLIVYYVNAQNEKEAHEVTINNGFATFETDHFSTYSLTEKTEEEENPQTFDGIMSYIIIGMTSLIGLAGTLLYIKNKKLN